MRENLKAHIVSIVIAVIIASTVLGNTYLQNKHVEDLRKINIEADANCQK